MTSNLKELILILAVSGMRLPGTAATSLSCQIEVRLQTPGGRVPPHGTWPDQARRRQYNQAKRTQNKVHFYSPIGCGLSILATDNS